MKKTKVNVKKLQLFKDKITDLDNQSANAAKGGLGLQTRNTFCNYCETDLCIPDNTGCNDCTVCPRTF